MSDFRRDLDRLLYEIGDQVTPPVLKKILAFIHKHTGGDDG